MNSWFNWEMDASISFYNISALGIFSSTIDNHLRPAKGSHSSISNLKWQIPVNPLVLFANSFKSILTSSRYISVCVMPILTSNKFVLNSEAIEVEELPIVYLSHTRNVEIAIWLASWIIILYILVIFVVVF